MRTRRFYQKDVFEGKILLDRPQSAHAQKVLRLEPGDAVQLFDGAGRTADCVVESVGQIVAVTVVTIHETPPTPPRIDIAAALPKGDRAATLIEKISELGANIFFPLVTQRSVVDPRKTKLERFRRIAIEAAKQCGSAWFPRIEEPVSIKDLIAEADHPMRLMADLDEQGARTFATTADRILVLIGPEGGWTDEERSAARSAGFLPWQFHGHTLRIETAAVAAMAILQQRAYSHIEDPV